MDNVALASINSFGNSPKADASPEESIFVLTSSQLRQIINDAIQPLKDAIAQFREERDQDHQEMVALQASVASLESLQESEVSRLCVDIATDRRRLAALERVEPQPLQKDRGEILRALIAANGGKMLSKDARVKMHLPKQTFSMLLASMGERIEIKPFHSDKRKDVLTLK